MPEKFELGSDSESYIPSLPSDTMRTVSSIRLRIFACLWLHSTSLEPEARGLERPSACYHLPAGKVNPDILLNGLGPLGSHVIPQDIWYQTVPPDLYGQGLREFDVEAPWVDDRGNIRPPPPPHGYLMRYLSLLVCSNANGFCMICLRTCPNMLAIHHPQNHREGFFNTHLC